MGQSTVHDALFNKQAPGLATAFQGAIDGLFASAKGGHLEVYTPATLLKLSGTQQAPNERPSTALKAGHLLKTESTEQLIETEIVRNVEYLRDYCQSSVSSTVFYIGQRNSYAPLSTSYELFDCLCRERNVSTQFRDYLVYFGDRLFEIEIAPPPGRFRALAHPKGDGNVPIECLYGVRFVERNKRQNEPIESERWSLRQCAIYFQSSQPDKGATWVFVTLPTACRQRFEEGVLLSSQYRGDDFFEGMLILLHCVVGNWRPYIVTLSTEVEEHKARVLGAAPDNRGPISMADSGQGQTIMVLDGKMGDALLAMRSNREDIAILVRAYKQLTSTSQQHDVVPMGSQEIMQDLDRSILQLEALRTRLNGIATLVSSFLELSNGLALQQLGKESKIENEQTRSLSERMHELAERSAQDTAAVTVLTILTLVYLPLTVVTNFFSTSFIERSTTADRISVSRDWWILVAVAVPLTGITLYIWWVWSRVKARHLLAGDPQGRKQDQNEVLKQA
jgi:Mg2+ and Co2+ transporter CorA